MSLSDPDTKLQIPDPTGSGIHNTGYRTVPFCAASLRNCLLFCEGESAAISAGSVQRQVAPGVPLWTRSWGGEGERARHLLAHFYFFLDAKPKRIIYRGSVFWIRVRIVFASQITDLKKEKYLQSTTFFASAQLLPYRTYFLTGFRSRMVPTILTRLQSCMFCCGSYLSCPTFILVNF